MTDNKIPRAYAMWLMRESKGDRDVLAYELFRAVVEDRNPQAWSILEDVVGEGEIQIEHFDIAADVVIEFCKKEEKQ